MKKNSKLKVSIIMGSQSDYKVMKLAEKTLKKIGVSFETKIISAHRTPQRMYEYAAKVEQNNISVIIAGCWRICSSSWYDISTYTCPGTWRSC